MRLGVLEDKNLVINILSSSFDKNKSVNFVAKQDKRRESRIRHLMEYSFLMGLNFGNVFISEDESACCIVLLPEKKKTTLKSLLWEVQLIYKCIGVKNVPKILKREKLLKKYHPKKSFAHLWYIGVLPRHQGKGFGSKLLQEVILHYKELQDTIYLETSTLRNLPFYNKHGFVIINKINLDYELYMLKK